MSDGPARGISQTFNIMNFNILYFSGFRVLLRFAGNAHVLIFSSTSFFCSSLKWQTTASSTDGCTLHLLEFHLF